MSRSSSESDDQLGRETRRSASAETPGNAGRADETVDQAVSLAPDDWVQPGTIVAERFLVRQIVGQGGFGLVLLAEDCLTRELLALKTPRLQTQGDDAEWSLDAGSGYTERAELLRDEVSRWMQLRPHPHIVSAWEYLEDRSRPFIAMQYVTGGRTLRERIATGHSDWRSGLVCGIQVCSALHHAWSSQQLVHRDIKPENILVTETGNSLLTDFGLSVVITTTGRGVSLAGTPAYMAPELWSDPDAALLPADIYALGLTLYETCTGSLPAAASDADDVGRDLSGAVPSVPHELALVIGDCLRTRPDQRPTGFASLEQRLQGVALAHGISLPATTPPSPSEHVRWLVRRSDAYARLFESRRALEAAQEALQLAPQDIGALHALANAHAQLGHAWRARRCYRRAHRLAPENFVITGNTANYFYQQGNHSRARDWLRRTIALVTERTGRHACLQWYTDLIVDLLPADEALRLCRDIVADAPDATVAWNNLAILLRRNGDYRGAWESALMALAINPNYAKAWVNLANALALLGDFRRTLDAATRAINLNAGLPGAYAARATALVNLGRVDEARETLQDGLRWLPQHPLLLEALQRLPG